MSQEYQEKFLTQTDRPNYDELLRETWRAAKGRLAANLIKTHRETKRPAQGGKTPLKTTSLAEKKEG